LYRDARNIEVVACAPISWSAPHAAHVLIVDDDVTVLEVLGLYLEREGFAVECFTDGLAALESARRTMPDLVVLDLMLPVLDGLEVFRRLRQLGPVPVVMLTARGDEEDRVAGLELGADDYVVKPFSPREVTARVKAVIGRSRALAEPGRVYLRAGAIEVDLGARQARLGGALIPLTPRELDLLAYFMSHPRVAFGRQELLEAVWGWAYGDTATVTVHIRRLREKIEHDPAAPALIQTVWGVGYRFGP
jgi:two-component system response regulator ResD